MRQMSAKPIEMSAKTVANMGLPVHSSRGSYPPTGEGPRLEVPVNPVQRKCSILLSTSLLTHSHNKDK